MSGDEERASNRSREVCYEARDAFYLCKDRTPVTEGQDRQSVCKDEAAAYEKVCLRSWRKYWDDRRANHKELLRPTTGKVGGR